MQQIIIISVILEPTVRAVKTRIECRGQKEPRNPRQWLEINKYPVAMPDPITI